MCPSIVPLPISSRIAPIRTSAQVKPSPMPIPSKSEATTPFLKAKASARARIMQLTTMRGMNIPSALSSAGAYPAINSCTTVTKPAMTTMKAGMRISSGMNLRSAATATFDPMRTAVAASPMPMAFTTLVVTAIVGHIPRTRTKVGFSVSIPFLISLRGFAIICLRLPDCFSSMRPPHSRL